MNGRLEYRKLLRFPNLENTEYQVTSEETIYTYNGEPQHAAIQEKNGMWKSKLGDWEDIQHELKGLENPNYYGVVQQFLKRML